MAETTLFDAHAVPLSRGEYGYRGAMGDIVELADGGLLLAYTVGGIAGRRSADRGRAWGPEEILFANPSGQGYYYRRSDDEGRTWSDQFLLTPQGGYVIVHNAKLRLLSSGTSRTPEPGSGPEPRSST
ncbi:MAG: sialidase family protein [Candidatus Latescibacterota bacterium]|jgi:hypothetical protein